MQRSFYSASIADFLQNSRDEILGQIARGNSFSLDQTQRDSWIEQIDLLKKELNGISGKIYFEYSIPRMGQRVDVVIVFGAVVFVLEFKVGESGFLRYAVEQVWDYALDLKNFHETSHHCYIAPILICTKAKKPIQLVSLTHQEDKVFEPILSNAEGLNDLFKTIRDFTNEEFINADNWEKGRYSPTPTIIEAARALYNGNSVEEIARTDADSINLSLTSKEISNIIKNSKDNSKKAICFVTGVPGAGKTLVGLNIATTYNDEKDDLYSVCLSGNGPLVSILKEALARDKVNREKVSGRKITKSSAMSEVKNFIQNIHHFRDECLLDLTPPHEHVALFDEAQRAWNLRQTSSFMARKKKRTGFNQSEPEFLISCLDRHQNWAVIVCLVGGGQEINTGEAGISEWIDSLNRSFPEWEVYIPPKLTDSEYGAGRVLQELDSRKSVNYSENLHLAVSIRSFRAETVSLFVKQLLDSDIAAGKETYQKIKEKYPFVITRNLENAKKLVKEKSKRV